MLFKLVDLYSAGVPLLDATVMLQREVAERLVAAPGARDYGVLSVLIRHWLTSSCSSSCPRAPFGRRPG